MAEKSWLPEEWRDAHDGYEVLKQEVDWLPGVEDLGQAARIRDTCTIETNRRAAGAKKSFPIMPSDDSSATVNGCRCEERKT
jgi:hypothetical protein